MRRSFLEYLLSLEADHQLPRCAATDDDLPRNLWPGQEEPLVRAWQKAEEVEFFNRVSEPLGSAEIPSQAGCVAAEQFYLLESEG
jgi:hypothetical protein